MVSARARKGGGRSGPWGSAATIGSTAAAEGVGAQEQLPSGGRVAVRNRSSVVLSGAHPDRIDRPPDLEPQLPQRGKRTSASDLWTEPGTPLTLGHVRLRSRILRGVLCLGLLPGLVACTAASATIRQPRDSAKHAATAAARRAFCQAASGLDARVIVPTDPRSHQVPVGELERERASLMESSYYFERAGRSLLAGDVESLAIAVGGLERLGDRRGVRRGAMVRQRLLVMVESVRLTKEVGCPGLPTVLTW
jgi:hypothetical protein